MSLNDSRMAYENEYDVMDKALPSGVRVGFSEEGQAINFRMRLNYARVLDRRFNKGRYPIDHPMHGRSEYDALTTRLREQGGRYWVYVERKPTIEIIEEIPEDDKAEPIKQVLAYRRF